MHRHVRPSFEHERLKILEIIDMDKHLRRAIRFFDVLPVVRPLPVAIDVGLVCIQRQVHLILSFPMPHPERVPHEIIDIEIRGGIERHIRQFRELHALELEHAISAAQITPANQVRAAR